MPGTNRIGSPWSPKVPLVSGREVIIISAMNAGGRYELKYVLDEQRAQAVARYVRSHMRPSEYNDRGSGCGYPVMSLYLDSPDFQLMRQAAEGHKNRFKLRIRFYDNQWEHPAFLEIKRRVGEVTRKLRALITREGVRELLCGGWPRMSHWPHHRALVKGRQSYDVYDRFWRLSSQLRAQGILYVTYLREAYEQPSAGELRVTFDRQIRGTLYDGSGRLATPARGFAPASGCPPYNFPQDAVVLELKFDHRAPGWMFELVQLFNLQRQSVCKYLACVEAMGLHWGNRVNPRAAIPLELGASDDRV